MARRLVVLAWLHDDLRVIATITSKGQITIPLRVREKLNLKAGDQLEFDENATILTARRIVNRREWEKTVSDWQKSAAKALKGHVWEKRPSFAIMDDLRGRRSESERHSTTA